MGPGSDSDLEYHYSPARLSPRKRKKIEIFTQDYLITEVSRQTVAFSHGIRSESLPCLEPIQFAVACLVV